MRLRSFATIAAFTLSALAMPFAAQAQARDARIRLAHFSPDANGVDVYIDGKKRMNRVPYQAVSDYITLPAGKHTIEVRGEGQPETSPALVTASPELAGGESFTAAALGPVANIQAKVFQDDLALPAAGKSKIRVIHASDGTPTVDVGVKDGDVLFPSVEFGAITTYVEVAAGPYVLQVRKAGDTAVAIEKPVTVQPGGIYTIAAVGGANKPPTLRGFVDLPAKSGTAAPTTVGTIAATVPGETTPADSSVDSTPNATKAGATPAVTKAVPETVPATEPVATIPPTKAPITPTTLPAAVGGGSTGGGKRSTGKTPIGGTNDNGGRATAGGSNAGGAGAQGTTDTKGSMPVGGAKTGFGGLSDTSSAISLLALVGAFIVMILAGLRRRYDSVN